MARLANAVTQDNISTRAGGRSPAQGADRLAHARVAELEAPPPAEHHDAVTDEDADVAPHLDAVGTIAGVALPVKCLVDEAVDERQDGEHHRGDPERVVTICGREQHAARDAAGDRDVVNELLTAAQDLLV